MKRTHPARCVICAAALGVLAAAATTQDQDRAPDPLAEALAKAAEDNQRVLLHLTGGDAGLGTALDKAIANYATLGKLIRYEYQLAAFAGESPAGMELTRRLSLKGAPDLNLPALAVVAADGKTVACLTASGMAEDDELNAGAVKRFLEKHQCPPMHARKVLADGIAAAMKTKRQAFVFLSAPW